MAVGQWEGAQMWLVNFLFSERKCALFDEHKPVFIRLFLVPDVTYVRILVYG